MRGMLFFMWFECDVVWHKVTTDPSCEKMQVEWWINPKTMHVGSGTVDPTLIVTYRLQPQIHLHQFHPLFKPLQLLQNSRNKISIKFNMSANRMQSIWVLEDRVLKLNILQWKGCSFWQQLNKPINSVHKVWGICSFVPKNEVKKTFPLDHLIVVTFSLLDWWGTQHPLIVDKRSRPLSWMKPWHSFRTLGYPGLPWNKNPMK
jgi:hypothetical protein